jgi:ABC-type polar amino acid transport system ATPase subunit
MPFTNTRLTALNTTVTAAGTAATKVAACLPGLLDVVIAEASKTAFLTPGQQQRLAILRADIVANAATMQTALGL